MIIMMNRRMKKKGLNNKGFSLVELIIVIAIMAILVAVMVPTLIKQVEKSKVSSDIQLADSIRNAFLCAATDARVISDAASAPYIGSLENGGMYVNDSSFLSSDCIMRESVFEIYGKSPATAIDEIKSTHTPGANIKVELKNGNVVVTIEGTDKTGKKHPQADRYIVVE